MKCLFTILLIIYSSSAHADLPTRPMSIAMIGGNLGAVSATQGENEGLIFEYTDDFQNWQLLADISPYIVEQTWTVYIPGNWLSGRFFVRARGYFADPLALMEAKEELFWPAVKIERLK